MDLVSKKNLEIFWIKINYGLCFCEEHRNLKHWMNSIFGRNLENFQYNYLDLVFGIYIEKFFEKTCMDLENLLNSEIIQIITDMDFGFLENLENLLDLIDELSFWKQLRKN